MPWSSRVETACDRVAFGAVLLMLSAPALAFGGGYAWRHAGIEISAAVLGAAWSVRVFSSGSLPRVGRCGIGRPWLAAALAGLLLLPLLPIPPAALERLAPRAFELAARSLPGWPAEEPFAAVLRAAAVEPAADGEPTDRWPWSWRPLAIVPGETARALSLGAAYVLLAAAVAAYPWRRGRVVLQRYVTVLIALAVVETLYAFVQQTQGSRRIWWFECQQGTSCLGTFINRNHFAGFVEMILPLVLGRAFWLARDRREAGDTHGRPDWLTAASNRGLARALAGGAVAVTLMVGLAVSSSRAALLVTLGSLAILGPLRPQGRCTASMPARPRLAAIGVLAALAALWLTFPQIGQRITLSDPARWALATETAAVIRDFPLFGVGLGNFGAVFPAYRSRTIRLWGFPITHAHNDYLEWLAEVGLAAALLSAVLLSGLGARAARALRGATPESSSAWLLWGVCTGALALLLHACVDFNLHTPANALVFAFLLGCITRLARQDAPAPERINAIALGRLLAIVGIATSLVWGLSAAERWRAEAAYGAVYPDPALRDASAGAAALSGDAALLALRRAAALSPRAPHIQAGLGRQLLQRAADGSSTAPDPTALDGAIHAFVRSLAAAPLQPHTALDLVAALEARAAAHRSALLPVLEDLVGRTAAVAPYDPEVHLRIADWYLRRWETLTAAGRARAARRIEAALAVAAQAPALSQRQRETRARYELARGIGSGGREREGG